MKQVRVTNKGHNARENTTLRGSPTRKRLRRKADKLESRPQYALYAQIQPVRALQVFFSPFTFFEFLLLLDDEGPCCAEPQPFRQETCTLCESDLRRKEGRKKRRKKRTRPLDLGLPQKVMRQDCALHRTVTTLVHWPAGI